MTTQGRYIPQGYPLGATWCPEIGAGSRSDYVIGWHVYEIGDSPSPVTAGFGEIDCDEYNITYYIPKGL